MPEILVREYKPEDREAVERCIFELQEDEYARRPHYWAAPTLELAGIYLSYTLEAVSKVEGAKVFTAEADKIVCGWLVVTIADEEGPDVALKKYGYISEVSVLREYQGRGVGKALMSKAEEYIKSLNLNWMELNVSLGNKALDFYRKLGYKDSSIRMEKKLT